MLSTVQSCYTRGIDGCLVQVEVDVSSGLPGFYICGLPDAAIKESKDRVRAAIKNSGFSFPLQRITVNLAPAGLKKVGSHFDLPIALGILAATRQVDPGRLANFFAVGELSLEGGLRRADGVLPMAEQLGKRLPGAVLAVPPENEFEASLAAGVKVLSCPTLTRLVSSLENGMAFAPGPHVGDLFSNPGTPSTDMSEVKGQKNAKRALEIAAAGGHNIMLVGPPGSGKTMLARRIPCILPPLGIEEALQVTKVFSVAGLLSPETPLVTQRPFRCPHHTSSAASIVGGGQIPKPGEISLATHGVLFLDEFTEYRRDVVEALRQPMEDRRVVIARTSQTVTFPADFMLVAAMNPCSCGFLGDDKKACRCTPFQVQAYRSRVSGPLLDRIEMHIHVPRIEYADIEDEQPGETSSAIRERVTIARKLQLQRLGKNNANMKGGEVRRHCSMDNHASQLLRRAFSNLGLSMRTYDRLLKVSRTIADLEGCETISAAHLAEALQYRVDF